MKRKNHKLTNIKVPQLKKEYLTSDTERRASRAYFLREKRKGNKLHSIVTDDILWDEIRELKKAYIEGGGRKIII